MLQAIQYQALGTVHWGRCWTEAPAAGFAMGIDMDFGRCYWAYVPIGYNYSANKSIVIGKKGTFTHIATNTMKGIKSPIDTLN
jgi:hypothetical protein